jgi:hypothetical protein
MKDEKKMTRSENALDELRSYSIRLDASSEATLVAQAQAGDQKAVHTLWHSVSSLGVQKLQKDLRDREWVNESEGSLYLTFMAALRRFDSGKGFRFTTWFGNKAGFAAKDIVKGAAEHGRRMVASLDVRLFDSCEEGVEETRVNRITQEDSAFYEEEITEEEIRGMIPIGTTLPMVMSLFATDSRENAMLAALGGVGCEPVRNQSELAEIMGCSRQNVSALMGRIRGIAVRELG